MNGPPRPDPRISPELLLERFEEVDFLELLWRRCQEKLAGEIEGVEAVLAAPELDGPELKSRLHRLRGLLVNFLQGQQSVEALVCCEAALETQNGNELRSAWGRFRSELALDGEALDRWLATQRE